MRIFHFHFDKFGVVVEGKANLANGGRLLVFARVDNEVLKEWVLFDFIAVTFLIDDEVDVWLHFSDFTNFIVSCVYFFVPPHFSEFSFGVVPEVEV